MLQAIIIDDEPASVETLKTLISLHLPGLHVMAGTSNCEKGIDLIEANHPDIVFLDISMPEMSGFKLLENLRFQDFDLIFTTAHERYAIQALRRHATDYLLKPIDIDELKNAVERVWVNHAENPAAASRVQAAGRLSYEGMIELPYRDGVIFQQVSLISHIISDGSYCTFHFVNGEKIMVSKNLGEFEPRLPHREFFRIHKSYIINLNRVKRYIRTDGNYVEMEEGSLLEVSRRRRDEFLQVMRAGGR